MRKVTYIAIGLALSFFHQVCLAQSRNCNLELTGFSSPADGTLIPYGDTFSLTGTIKNNGPGDILAGDTIWYLTPLNEQPSGTILQTGIPKNSSVALSFISLTNQNTTGEDQSFDQFCVLLFDPARFFDQPGWQDPDTSNNLHCTSFTLAPKGATGIVQSEEAPDKLTCYPNPAKDEIHIALEEFKGKTTGIRILDIFGRTVLSRNTRETEYSSGNTILLDVSALSAGTYIVEVQSEQRKAISKIVLQY